MELIFKVITPSTSGKDYKIKDTNFKTHFAGAHANMAWEELTPAIRQATRKYILPHIGEELYDDLAAKFNAGDVLSDAQSTALELMQDALAHYVVYYVMPKINISIASMGVQQKSSSEGTSNPANQWSFKGGRWDIMLSADDIFDQLLTFLDKQIKASDAYFDLFKNSEAYNAGVSDFFRSASEVDNYLNIQGSIRSFYALIRYIKKAEQKYILPTLCTDQYSDLATKYKENTLNEEEDALLKMVQQTLAEWALFEAIPHLALVIDSDGFKIVSSTDGMDQRKNMTNTTHEKAIERLKYFAEENGNTFRAELIAHLYKNADTFTLFKASDCFADPDDANTVFDNPEDIGAVGIF